MHPGPLDFAFLGERQSCEGRLDPRTCLCDPLLQIGARRDGVAQPAFQRPVFFCQSAGDFNQAGYAFAKHLDFFVHVAGW